MIFNVICVFNLVYDFSTVKVSFNSEQYESIFSLKLLQILYQSSMAYSTFPSDSLSLSMPLPLSVSLPLPFSVSVSLSVSLPLPLTVSLSLLLPLFCMRNPVDSHSTIMSLYNSL
jgi:hypothetical protein